MYFIKVKPQLNKNLYQRSKTYPKVISTNDSYDQPVEENPNKISLTTPSINEGAGFRRINEKMKKIKIDFAPSSERKIKKFINLKL